MTSKTPSIWGSRWSASEHDGNATFREKLQNAEIADPRYRAAAIAQLRAVTTTPATTQARPVVPGGMERQRQLLRARLRQSVAGDPQDAQRMVPGGLAGERKLLHPLNAMNSRDRRSNSQRAEMTSKKHNLTISEPQRRLIVQALGTAIANGESARASGSLDDREGLFELICIFSTIADDDMTSN
jgi:hypothetical protein